jgi:hypothetical protein
VLPSLQTLIQRELNSSERLLWTGAPRQGLRLRAADVFMVPFSLLWGGFVIFWEYSVLRQSSSHGSGSPDLFMVLWGIPFVLVGIYLIVGRFFADAFQRARTIYAVTDQRILIVTTLWNKQVKSVQLKTLPEISLTEKSDGSGTITFGPQPPYARMMGGGWPGANKQAAPTLEFVEQVRSVYDLIQGSVNEAGRSRRSE